MADEKNADRSSIEIKTLLRKLHPDRGNHKDRIKKLNRFRSYVMVSGRGGVPEFYDDDIPLLFLGSAAPAAFLDDPDDAENLTSLYGLLQACGTPSGEHDGTLKRSARHAMNLLKWLLLDWKSPDQGKDDLNVFAQSFLSLPAEHYHHMGLDFHCDDRKGDRGGSKEDACQVIVLILTKHLSEDGESAKPLMMEELMSRPIAQQEFEIWLANNTSASVQDIIKNNAATRQAELALQQRQDMLATKALGGIEEFEEDSDQENSGHPNVEESETNDEDDGFGGDDDGDVMAAFRKRQKNLRKELKEAEGRGEITGKRGVATRWEDSQLAREKRAWAASAARAGQHQTVRDSQNAAQEAAEREEEKSKLMSLDPLGIRDKEEDFDMRAIEAAMAEHMEQALNDLQEEVQKAESAGSEELTARAAAQKESLEALVERLGGLEALENPETAKCSVLPPRPNFDPLLCLTLVHRKTTYDELMGSMDRLFSKTENQAEQLQNLVRENFPLFVRCAEGFEEFRRSSESEVGMSVNERIDKLEAIAESSAFQAKKSFKPLLDNTSEVRKVQSAMSVLQRVAPILQVPALMRQHIENRRYSQALKTYRRVLVVGDNCKIELLNHVKKQAEQCVRDARRDLEFRIAQDNASVEDLGAAIRDLAELLELDVPNINHAHDGDDGSEGVFQVGGNTISIRGHPPALACLLLQAAHFTQAVKKLVSSTDETCQRIYAGESLSQAQDPKFLAADMNDNRNKSSGNQWKYDVLDARVLSTMKAISMARSWLPRLISVAQAAREDEKRRAARVGPRRKNVSDNQLTAFEVFASNISPIVTLLVEHATFSAIGSNTRSGAKDVRMTFGQNAPDKLHALLRSPLPPSQSTKVGKEIADLVEVLSECSGGVRTLQPLSPTPVAKLSLLDECKTLADSAVVTIEKRRCIYAFDVCARACSNRASGSGRFDTDALLHCLQNLAEQLSRPEQCAAEVEKGCELVVGRCCEGLASYVRDRDDAARLTAVSECAQVLSERIGDVAREASTMSPHGEAVEAVMVEEVMELENALFDEYLESIRLTVASSVRVGWLDKDTDVAMDGGDASLPPTFPAYLSASLLAIVRCRAQVEQALGECVRKAEGVQYQHLAMTTVSDGVVEGICNEILKRKLNLRVRQADRLANELEFLRNTLKKFLGEESRALLESTLNVVNTKAGRGQDYQADGPDGLAAIEELERLGRVYVLCLGD